MFCYQCQETAKNQGCTIQGVCGKKDTTANLQDVLVYALKGISVVCSLARKNDISVEVPGLFIADGLFCTITNANFDDDKIVKLIVEAIQIRNKIKDLFLTAYKEKNGREYSEEFAQCVNFSGNTKDELLANHQEASVLATDNEDVRSLRELLIYGLKGLAAYASHAAVLGYEDASIYDFCVEALNSTTIDLSVDEMIALVLKCGEFSVKTMALLDKANTTTYGNPEISKVNIGVGSNPGILISGHDLKDMEDLLKQTEGTGVDIYTHGEMLPANYYPEFKKYTHLIGNYGNAWYTQDKEFASFNGPILMTTNCITPVKDEYKDRFYTTGMAGYPGVKHIEVDADGKKDFSAIIAQAKTCSPPVEIETGEIVGGFAHNQVLALADKVVDAVKSGAIKRFVVMAGCDGRQKSREYFTDLAKALPEGTIILTAGCAKYRYNKLELGDIGGIPRVLDAGQCNDCYSLAVIAMKLQEVFELESINDLPLSFDIAWYEQKAVAVLLALLHLGVKGIRMGPSLPAFLSPTVVNVLVENFDIKLITDVDSDVAAIMEGK